METLRVPEDLLSLPYTPDLTQAGISFLCRSLPRIGVQRKNLGFDQLRQLVAEKLVELAFRRYLTDLQLPFQTLESASLSAPDVFPLALGGRPCKLFVTLVSGREEIRGLHRRPARLLTAPALVPELQPQETGSESIFLFAYLTALVTRGREDFQRALTASQPTYLMTLLPPNWMRPAHWHSLGALALKTDASQALSLELGGQNAQRAFHSRQLSLTPRQRKQLGPEFFALAYVQSAALPDGALGVHSPTLDETHLVAPTAWGNLWVYGMRIILAGYCTSTEFRRRATRLSAGELVLGTRTRGQHLAMPLSGLRSMRDLVARVQDWAY